VISRVIRPSPGFSAGLHIGDEILSVNGIPLAGMSSAEFWQALLVPGEPRQVLEVRRLGALHRFELTAGRSPAGN
jgi:C-terminal processing protease CtpA/Prc